MSDLYVLVDFDNLAATTKRKPIMSIIKGIFEVIHESLLVGKKHVIFRLYGGWSLDDGRSTKLATQMICDLDGSIILARKLQYSGENLEFIVRPTLATAALAMPSTQLLGTYQPKRSLRNTFIDSKFLNGNCTNSNGCRLCDTENLVKEMKCPDTKCNIEFDQIFYTSEQKQVDTLIIADMAFVVFTKLDPSIVIVSSDADMWPGVLLCLQQNVKVQQISTNTPLSSTPNIKPLHKKNLVASKQFKN